MMNKLFFITLLCFISCQPSDEDLKINVSNTIRVSVSGLNINKVPISNARIQQEDVELYMSNVVNVNDSIVNIDIKVNNFYDIISFQASLNWDPTIIKFKNVINFGISDLGINNFGTTTVKNGHLRFLWEPYDANALNVEDSTILFTVQYQILSDVNHISLSFIDKISIPPYPIEFANSKFEILVVNTYFTNITLLKQQRIIFIRPFGGSLNNYYSCTDASFEPILYDEFDVTITAPPDYGPTIWMDNIISVFTNIDKYESGYESLPLTLYLNNEHSHTYHSLIYLEDTINEYQLNMNTLSYELIITSDFHLDVDRIEVVLLMNYKKQVTHNTEFDYIPGVVPDTITLQVINQNASVFKSNVLINFFGYFEVQKFRYVDVNNNGNWIWPNYYFNADKGKRYTLTLPAYNTNITQSNSRIFNIKSEEQIL